MVARALKRGLKITGELSEQAGLVPCRLPRGCGEIGIHAVFRWRWANARGGSSPLSRIVEAPRRAGLLRSVGERLDRVVAVVGHPHVVADLDQRRRVVADADVADLAGGRGDDGHRVLEVVWHVDAAA